MLGGKGVAQFSSLFQNLLSLEGFQILCVFLPDNHWQAGDHVLFSSSCCAVWILLNPQLKHPAGILWMKAHSRNTEWNNSRCSQSFTPESLFSLCHNHTGFSLSLLFHFFLWPCKAQNGTIAATEQDFQMRWKCKAEIASLNFVCSDTSMFLLYSLDSDVNCAFSVLQSTLIYSSALTNF